MPDIAGSLDALSEPCLQCSMVRSGDAMALGGGQCDQCGVNWAWSSLLAITAAVNYFCSRNCLFLTPKADRFSRRSYYYENVTSGLYLVVIVHCSIYQMLYCWLTKKQSQTERKKIKRSRLSLVGLYGSAPRRNTIYKHHYHYSYNIYGHKYIVTWSESSKILFDKYMIIRFSLSNVNTILFQ